MVRPESIHHPQHVVYGDGAIHTVPQIARDHGWRRVLLLTGRRSFAASGAASVLPRLHEATFVEHWNAFATNPEISDLIEGLRVLETSRPDAVIAVGGGSVMDMGKLVAAYAGESNLDDLRIGIERGIPVRKRDVGLALAPTTFGSGSEATHFSVLYIGDTKFSVAGRATRPDSVILDPTLGLSGSSYQRATSGIDAIAQAIESLWAVDATDTSRRSAERALEKLLPCIEPFVSNPTIETARSMCIGSHLAGRAIDISRTTAAHALSYAITKRYGISHGHAVALTLGQFIEAHARQKPGMLSSKMDPKDFRAAMTLVLKLLNAYDGESARRAFSHLLERIGLSPRLADIGVATADDREWLATSVNVDRLENNPVVLNHSELVTLLDDTMTDF